MLRFASNPTGDMDINNLRIAIFNHILSKQLNEKLLIRVENSDDKEISEILNIFSIDYERVTYQSDNLKYHQKLAMQLMSQKNAFACFCSDEKLDELKQKAKKEGKPFYYDGFCETLSDETILNCNAPFTVRIKKPESNLVDSFIILKHDKTPTYDYATAVDDMLYDVSTVIQSEDSVLEAPKQEHIRSLLNYDKKIDYIYLANILTNKKDLSVKELIDKGFLPSAIANYLVLLGNKTPNEIFTLEEAIQWFDINNISKDSVKFDINRLKVINKKHLENIDEMRLSKILGFADSDIGKLAKLFLNDVSTIKDLKEKVDLVFSPKAAYKGYEEEFTKLNECMKSAPFFNDLEELKSYILTNTSLEEEILLKLLKYIMIGTDKDKDLDISKIYPLIKNYLGEIIK